MYVFIRNEKKYLNNQHNFNDTHLYTHAIIVSVVA